MKQRKSKRGPEPQRVLRPDAAGVDIGATEIYVAVPRDKDPEPVRCFQTFTGDLEAAADWVQLCGCSTVAMEATGVYWIPLAEVLERRGIEVCVVNARQVKNVPGRKSDVSDGQWIQYLHSVGLLAAGYRPEGEIRQVRVLWRHRASLLAMASQHILHMQKALSQMNVQVHHVLADIAGVSGMRILDAIVSGERDAEKLAALCHGRVPTSPDTMARALQGYWQREHLFTLKQSLEGYRYHCRLVEEVDRQMEQLLQALPTAPGGEGEPPPSGKRTPPRRQHHHPGFDPRRLLYRVNGVDPTEIPGISSVTAQTLLAEIGPQLARFRSGAAFASWLGLCPERRISGGKVYSTRTRPVKSRAALALRLGARSLHHAQNELGEFFRRMRRKLGTPQAITATAHKLARIVYHVLSTRTPYDSTHFRQLDDKARQRNEQRLRAHAAPLGFDLAPHASIPSISVCVP